MFAFTLVAGLLTASTFASPIEIRETPTDLHNKCDAVVVNADPPNDYCYQYCDLEVTNRIAEKPINVTEWSYCSDGPDGGCLISVLNQVTVGISTTETHGTADTTTVEAGFSFAGVSVGASYSHMVESSHASTDAKTTTTGFTNNLYVPQGKSGHVVFFPYYEVHCGPTTVLRKPNLQDQKNFNCNPDYNILISHKGSMDRISGMQYNWAGIDRNDIYNADTRTCIRLPLASSNGEARGQYQICDSDNTENRCKECKDCSLT